MYINMSQKQKKPPHNFILSITGFLLETCPNNIGDKSHGTQMRSTCEINKCGKLSLDSTLSFNNQDTAMLHR
jgi:hypothetical protein